MPFEYGIAHKSRPGLRHANLTQAEAKEFIRGWARVEGTDEWRIVRRHIGTWQPAESPYWYDEGGVEE
jgi:hypothetical protein